MAAGMNFQQAQMPFRFALEIHPLITVLSHGIFATCFTIDQHLPSAVVPNVGRSYFG